MEIGIYWNYVVRIFADFFYELGKIGIIKIMYWAIVKNHFFCENYYRI